MWPPLAASHRRSQARAWSLSIWCIHVTTGNGWAIRRVLSLHPGEFTETGFGMIVANDKLPQVGP